MFKDFQVKMISKDVSGACKFIKKEVLDLCFPVNCLNFKNTFLYRTPPVAASENTIFSIESMKQQINTNYFLVRSWCFTENER